MKIIFSSLEWIGALLLAFVGFVVAGAILWALPAVIVGVIVHALGGDWTVIRTAFFWIVPSLALVAAPCAMFTIHSATPGRSPKKGGV